MIHRLFFFFNIKFTHHPQFKGPAPGPHGPRPSLSRWDCGGMWRTGGASKVHTVFFFLRIQSLILRDTDHARFFFLSDATLDVVFLEYSRCMYFLRPMQSWIYFTFFVQTEYSILPWECPNSKYRTKWISLGTEASCFVQAHLCVIYLPVCYWDSWTWHHLHAM